MSTISPAALAEVRAALERYESEVRPTALTAASQPTYLLHASNFVRWLRGDLDPGERVVRPVGRRGR